MYDGIGEQILLEQAAQIDKIKAALAQEGEKERFRLSRLLEQVSPDVMIKFAQLKHPWLLENK